MALSIFLGLAAFVVLVWMLRRDGVSLGLPIAYLFGLLLIHLPGAFAHLAGGNVLFDSDIIELGVGFAAIGAICFVAGVGLSRYSAVAVPPPRAANDIRFWLFCLVSGWILTYALSPFVRIPSVGAVVEKGGGVWMLGVLLGLRAAMMRWDPKWIAIWIGSLAVYPTLMLLLGGFLSYGSKALTVVLAVLAISTRSGWRVAIGIIVVSYLSLAFFLSYFQNRDEIRDAVWGGAAMEERIDASMGVFRDFDWISPANETQMTSLDRRLNQNYFAGLAADRIQAGEVDYLYGRSLWEGLLALVPRIVWPDKPVFAGSPQIVSEMTGLVLNEDTSFGVGNVMEFYINFGTPGLMGGFLLLGWLLGWLDRRAAIADRSGDLGAAIVFFLPAVALIQPNGSLVELTGGSAAAWVAAKGWQWGWETWSGKRSRGVTTPGTVARRRP